MRLFTGIDLPEDVAGRLERLLVHLRPLAQLRWSPVYNLHITTKFIGEWTEPRIDALTTALQTIGSRPPVPISVSGVGWFPNPHSPRVFWAGVHSPALTDLAEATEDAVETLGIAREKRDYSPHLTLARVPPPAPLQPVRQAIAQLDSLEFGSFAADRFHLYQSQPGSAGSVYTKLAEFPFAE